MSVKSREKLPNGTTTFSLPLIMHSYESDELPIFSRKKDRITAKTITLL